MEKGKIARYARKKFALNKHKIFSVLLVLFFGAGLLAHPVAAKASTLSFSPVSGSPKVGATFSVSIIASSVSQAINALSGAVSFPVDKLEVASLSKSGSIISLWVQEPSFSNAAGIINFEGIILNPGFTGSAGKIISVSFKAKASGSATLSFSSGSLLANDGKGTSVLEGLGSATFAVEEVASPLAPPSETNISAKPAKVPAAPIIFSSTHSDSEKWYSNSIPEFNWKLTSDIIGVSAYINDKPTSNPGPISDGLFNSKTYQNLKDGVWYFHLKLKNSYGWSPVSHFKFQIDTTPPELPVIKFTDGKDTDNPRPTLTITHKDLMSGSQGHCEIKIDNGEWFSSNYETLTEVPDQPCTFHLPLQEQGRHTILVKALDNAGNFAFATEEFSVRSLPDPVFTDYPRQIRTEETFALKGSAVANADITIWLQREKDEPKSYAVKSDENGGFSFTAGEKLKDGIYKIWAQATDKRGAKSDISEKITTEVVLPYVLKIGRLAIDYLTVINTLIILIIGILAVIVYIWYRISFWRRKIRKETRETKETVRKAFNILKTKVEDEVARMDGNPRLNKREKEVCDNLKDALRISEEFIEKEISNIEKRLK